MNPRKPTSISKLQGNPGRRALPKHEPMPQPLMVDHEVPAAFSSMPVAAEAWLYMLPILCNMRVMTQADIPMLMLYCEARADELNAAEQMGSGGYVQVAQSGHAQVSAWYTIKRDAIARQMKILSLFGMTPSDRTKVQTVALQKKANPFESL